jgi:hypothetical protein
MPQRSRIEIMVKMSELDIYILHVFTIRGEPNTMTALNADLTMIDDRKGIITSYPCDIWGGERAILHVIKHGGAFYMHNESCLPAFESDAGVCIFFINGTSYLIEDLPCDDMMKTYLTLKYSLISTTGNNNWHYHVYKCGTEEGA